MDDLRERVAVVTGAASGLGRAMAQRFAAEGMKVMLADIDADGVADTARALVEQGRDVRALRVDVSDSAAVEMLAEQTMQTFGAVHLVCNNAGVVKNARSWALTIDDWNWVLGVDLWSAIHGVRSFVPRLLAQGNGGHVVNTASMAGLLPIPNLAAYAVAKSGVVALSESLQMELAAEGSDIGVSVLAPGYIATRISDSARNRPSDLGDSAAPPSVQRTSSGLQSSMTADNVADQVVAAVRAKRFWILTHDNYREVIRQRAAGIGTDAQPVPPPIW